MGSIVTMALWRDSAEVSSYQYPTDPYYCAYMVSVTLSWMDENAWNQVLGLIVTAWIHIRLSTSRTIDTILLSCMMLTGFKTHRPPKIRSKFASNLLFVCETSIYKMITGTHIGIHNIKSLITKSLTGMKITTIPPPEEICTSNTKPAFVPQRRALPLFGSGLLLLWMQTDFTHAHTHAYIKLEPLVKCPNVHVICKNMFLIWVETISFRWQELSGSPCSKTLKSPQVCDYVWFLHWMFKGKHKLEQLGRQLKTLVLNMMKRSGLANLTANTWTCRFMVWSVQISFVGHSHLSTLYALIEVHGTQPTNTHPQAHKHKHAQTHTHTKTESWSKTGCQYALEY